MIITWTEIAAIASVVGTTTGALVAIFKVVRSVEERLDKRFKESDNKFEDKISVVWRRFDENKTQIDSKLDKYLETIENKYVRKDIYTVNYEGMKLLMEQQYESLSELIDERLRHINSVMEEIRKCPALRNGHNGDK